MNEKAKAITVVSLIILVLAGVFLYQGYLGYSKGVDQALAQKEEEINTIIVRTARATNYEDKLKKRVQTSGCAQGTVFGDLMEKLEDIFVDEDSQIHTSWIETLLKKLNTQPNLYLKAGAIIAGPEGPLALFTRRSGELVHLEVLRVDGGHERLGTLHKTIPEGWGHGVCMPRQTGEWLGVVDGNEVSIVRVGRHGLGALLPGAEGLRLRAHARCPQRPRADQDALTPAGGQEGPQGQGIRGWESA